MTHKSSSNSDKHPEIQIIVNYRKMREYARVPELKPGMIIRFSNKEIQERFFTLDPDSMTDRRWLDQRLNLYEIEYL